MKNKKVSSRFNQVFQTKKHVLVAAMAGGLCSIPSYAAMLEEVVVTAQKRSESLQDVPLSITAFSGNMLEIQRVTDVQAIAAATPNFTYSSFAGSRPEFTIRGIGTTGVVRAGLDNAVNLFLDEVYISRSSAAVFELFDLEQVSVLRGPQGTLFGKNVVGGALSLTTKKPSLDESEYKIQVGAGNEGYTEVRAYASGPLADSVAAKVSFSKQDRDGLGKDLISGEERDDLDTLSLRGQLMFALSDDAELLVTADYSEDESKGKTLSDTAESNRANEAFDFDPRTANLGGSPGVSSEQQGISAKLDYGLDSGSVTAILAYRQSESSLEESFTAATVPEFGGTSAVSDLFIQDEDNVQVTIEVRYATENDGPLNWVAGLYGIQEDTERLECERAVTDYVNGLDSTFSFFIHGPFVSDSSKSCWDQNNETNGWAIYWDGSYEISDTITARVGARYTEEDRESRTIAEAVEPLDVLGRNISIALAEEYNVSVDDTFDGFTPRLVLEWRPVEEAMLYASASRGFKSGGFDGKTATAVQAVEAFDNEFAWSYELGAKTTFLDNSLQFNAAVFHTDFTDLQQLILVPTGGLAVVNVGQATTQGIEVEMTWVPTDSWLVTAGYGYLDAEYDEFVIPLTGEDRSGNKLPQAPENKFNISATYTIPLDTGAEVNINGNYLWTDDFFNEGSNSPAVQVDNYGLINGAVSYLSPEGQIKVSLWGKNLTDEDYPNRRHSFLGTAAVHLAAPRTYGVNVTWSF